MSGAAPKDNDQNKGSHRRKRGSQQNRAQETATNVVRSRPETSPSYDAAFPTLQEAASKQNADTAANVPPSNIVGVRIRNRLPYLLLLIFARRSQ